MDVARRDFVSALIVTSSVLRLATMRSIDKVTLPDRPTQCSRLEVQTSWPVDSA